MDIPEKLIVSKIAIAYSIPRKDAIVAILNRGMDSIAKQIEKNDANKKVGPLSDDSDYGGD
jgi:hypothetical protein